MRWILQSFNITEKQDLAELIAAIQSIHTKSAVVVIDTLNRASPTADENSSKDMGAIIASLASGKLPYTTGQAISADAGMLVPRF